MRDNVGELLVAYENALYYQMKSIDEKCKTEEGLYALLREHYRMSGILTSAMWAAAALKAPSPSSSSPNPDAD